MKVIDLSTSSLTLPEILQLASEENVILTTSDGRQFVAEIDDFTEEVCLTRPNEALMRLLDDRAKEPATLSLKEVREQLQKKRGSARPKPPRKQ
jgi:hypothetical protein